MNTIYNDYLGSQFVLLSGLARRRVESNAPLLGGITCSDDGGASYRNPTEEEKSTLRGEVAKFCYDCGDARQSRADAVIIPCGHVAHPNCHVTDGRIVCALGRTVDPERVNDYEALLPAGRGG